jgi:ribose transport system substrate-binding protein
MRLEHATARRSLVRIVSLLACVALLTSAFGSVAAAEAEAEECVPPGPDEKLDIVLSNNYVGNQWRNEMQNIVKAMVENNEPFKDRVDLKIIVAEGDPTAQIQSLNSIIATKPDAILLDASSPSALNPTIQRAVDEGIVVVSFDQTITEPSAYRVDEHNDAIFEAMGRWLAESIGGEGGLVQDVGLPGNPRSVQSNDVLAEVFKEYPNVDVIAQYEGNYAPGPSGKALATILAANPAPAVGAVYNFAGADGVIEAFRQAQYPYPAIANSGDIGIRHLQQVEELSDEGLQYMFANNPPTFGGYALWVAWRVLNCEDPVDPEWGLTAGEDPKQIFLPLEFYTTNGIEPELTIYEGPAPKWMSTDELMPLLDLGLSPDVQTPFSIPQSPVTAEQVFGTE